MQKTNKRWALPRVIKIYFAGGMRTDWQDIVRARIKGHPCIVIFIDPREHGQRDEACYTAWDLEGVADSDIVFGNLEADNPSGAGLAVEFGYARGMERGVAEPKRIIFVNDPKFPQNRYFGMARALSDVVVDTLDAGIEALIAVLNEYAPPVELGGAV